MQRQRGVHRLRGWRLRPDVWCQRHLQRRVHLGKTALLLLRRTESGPTVLKPLLKPALTKEAVDLVTERVDKHTWDDVHGSKQPGWGSSPAIIARVQNLRAKQLVESKI